MSAHIDYILQDYIDGSVNAEERAAVERHLSECEACRSEYEALRLLVTEVGLLSKSIEPERELWPSIEQKIVSLPPVHPDLNGRSPDRPAARRHLVRWGVAAAAAVAALVFAVRYFVPGPSWEVDVLQGTPSIAERLVSDAARMGEGDWLVTDGRSSARVEVGVIGHVDVGPGTEIQVRSTDATDHRLAMTRGTIEARIFAPPRLFIVETPSATAIDLGCVYTLEVDSTGMSILHVKAGYVELVKDGRTSVVPAGKMALARPGKGPGTVFSEDASPALREALRRYDFEGGGLREVLSNAGPRDGATLWQIVSRAPAAERAAAYDRLTELVTPPEGVTREGVLSGDPNMLFAWDEHVGLNTVSWWGYVKKKTEMKGR